MRRGRSLRISALFCADQSRKPTPAVLVRLTGRRHCIFSGVTFFGPTDRATAARQGFAVITIRTNRYTDPCWRPSSLLCRLPLSASLSTKFCRYLVPRSVGCPGFPAMCCGTSPRARLLTRSFFSGPSVLIPTSSPMEVPVYRLRSLCFPMSLRR